jgi:hypothetical protein
MHAEKGRACARREGDGQHKMGDRVAIWPKKLNLKKYTPISECQM